MPQQRGLLLGAGDRDPELFVIVIELADSSRRTSGSSQNALDIGIVQRFGQDAPYVGAVFSLR